MKMSVCQVSLLLPLLLVAPTWAGPWQDLAPRRYRPGEPPSLQDLDIGLGIGVPDDAVAPQRDVDVGATFADPRGAYRRLVSGASPYLAVGETPYQAREERLLVGAQGTPLLTARDFGLSGAEAAQREVNVGVFANPRSSFRKVVSLSPYLPGAEPLPYQAREERVLVDARGSPLMTARDLGDRQIGTFRLRNDRGYQVAMGVPQVPLDQEAGDGILVMEMKATVYRPVS